VLLTRLELPVCVVSVNVSVVDAYTTVCNAVMPRGNIMVGSGNAICAIIVA
jgi:hypothetical protein